MTNDSKYDILPRSVGDTDSDDFTDSDELLDSDDVKTYELVDKPAIVQQAKRKHKNGKINAAVVNSDPKIRERERKSKYSGVNLNRANQETSKYNNLLDTTDDEEIDTEDDETYNKTKPKKIKQKAKSGIPYNYYTFNNEPTNLPNLPNNANDYNTSLVQSNSPIKRKKWYERSYVIYAFVAVVLLIAIGVGLFIYFRKRRDYEYAFALSAGNKLIADKNEEEQKKLDEKHKDMLSSFGVNNIPTNKSKCSKFDKKNSKNIGGRKRDARGRFVKS